MDLVATLHALQSAAAPVGNLRAFILDQGLSEILSEVGARHMIAGRHSLAEAGSSTDPVARINNAAKSFIEAYAHISPGYSSGTQRFFQRIVDGFDLFRSNSGLAGAYGRACVCALLVAACYKCARANPLRIGGSGFPLQKKNLLCGKWSGCGGSPTGR
jgi:hypothetical protein